MKVFVLLNSDSLAIPSLTKLSAEGKLSGLAVVAESSDRLIPKIKASGIKEAIYILKKQTWIETLQSAYESTKAEQVWIFTFPWKIPDELLMISPKGFYNFHFGLLPKYKGADPIFWQLKNREEFGGLSVHKVTDQMDSGPLVLQKQLPVIPGEGYGFHCQRLGQFCAELLPEIVGGIDNNTVIEGQLGGQTGWWNKPSEKDLTINWERMDADEIEWLINATNPKYGGARTSVGDTKMLIREVTSVNLEQEAEALPGTIVHSDAVYGIIVACRNGGFLRITIAEIEEGLVSGVKLFNLGMHKGHRFNNISSPKEMV